MPRNCFFLQNSRCDSNKQPCLKTTGLYNDLLLLSSLFHLFYFVVNAPISFNSSFPISPFFSVVLISKNFYAIVHYLFSCLIQDSTLYNVALHSFSCRQQILIRSLFIFILLQIFSIFPCYGFLDTAIIQKWIFSFQKHKVCKVSPKLISHFDINFSCKCFLLCNHPLCFFSLLTLLRLSMAKSKMSFGKCHIALENIWVTFKYLLILISKIISQ